MKDKRRMMYTMFNVGLVITVLVSTRFGVEGIFSYYIEDAYFDSIDPEYMDPNTTNLEVAWINSTYSALSMNLSIIKALPMDATGHYNIFQRSMGEYKMPSGISISRPWCQIIASNVAADVVRAMNMTQCPTVAGFYSVLEWRPICIPWVFLPGTQYRISFVLRNKETIFIRANVFESIY